MSHSKNVPTLYSARGLAMLAGVSKTVAYDRLRTGNLIPCARNCSGDLLFHSTQAINLTRKIARKGTRSTPNT